MLTAQGDNSSLVVEQGSKQSTSFYDQDTSRPNTVYANGNQPIYHATNPAQLQPRYDYTPPSAEAYDPTVMAVDGSNFNTVQPSYAQSNNLSYVGSWIAPQDEHHLHQSSSTVYHSDPSSNPYIDYTAPQTPYTYNTSNLSPYERWQVSEVHEGGTSAMQVEQHLHTQESIREKSSAASKKHNKRRSKK